MPDDSLSTALFLVAYMCLHCSSHSSLLLILQPGMPRLFHDIVEIVIPYKDQQPPWTAQVGIVRVNKGEGVVKKVHKKGECAITMNQSTVTAILSSEHMAGRVVQLKAASSGMGRKRGKWGLLKHVRGDEEVLACSC